MENVWKNDLPERFDPMTVKELRQSLRRGSFVYPFMAIQFFAVMAMAMEFQTGSSAGGDARYSGMLNISMLWSSGPFWIVVSALCLVIMPLGGLVLMGQEWEEGNHELLLLTKLNRWRVVFGKFITLWGLCALTFVSLLPYVVVRYMVGGIEWWHEAACGATILGGSAILCAGAIGASAFKRMAVRIPVFGLFVASMAAGCGIPLGASGAFSGGCGVLYHITALVAVACYVTVGLALARSKLRLSIFAFEVNPSSMIIGLMIFAPFVIGLITAISVGTAGLVGLGIVAVVAAMMDVTPKAPPLATRPVIPGAQPPQPLPTGNPGGNQAPESRVSG